MKKTLFILVFALLLIAGCSGENNPDPNQNNEEQNEVNNQEPVNDTNNHDETNNEGNNPDTNSGANDDQPNGENVANDDHDNSVNNNNDDPEDEMTLKEKTYNFFVAQRENDVEKMKSYLANTASYDEKEDIFYFDDITYPHEMERFEIADQDLDYRYTQEEADYVIVGFASVNYEEEYSFVIDFTWILENDEWKIQDMDVNK